MTARTIYVACSEWDAVPFLRGRPAAERESTLVVAPAHVAAMVTAGAAAAQVLVLGHGDDLRRLRRLIAARSGELLVLTGNEYASLPHSLGYARALLLAPWVVGSRRRVALAQLDQEGASVRYVGRLSRAELLVYLYKRQMRSVVAFLPALPRAALTVAQALAYVGATERRARRRPGSGCGS